MSVRDPLAWRGRVVYQIFVRNYGPTGRLSDVTDDLARIRALGVDTIYLMPIQPIGVEGRKGTFGSPYAIRDFTGVSSDLGTINDFDALVDGAHEIGLSVIMDVVFNHTSPDSVLAAEHPEFFLRDEHGRPVAAVPAWTDIADMDMSRTELQGVLVDALEFWVSHGVDGFRCDSANLTPLEFWRRARDELEAVRPGLLWLAESVHPVMVERFRREGSPMPSEAEMLTVFDAVYTYDVWGIWQSAVTGKVPVARYLEMIRWQQATLPLGATKLRHVENHDNFRIMRLARTRDQAVAWTILTAALPGALMFYAGQESGSRTWPNLFDRDPVDWGDYELSPLLTELASLQKHPTMLGGSFAVLADEPCVQVLWRPNLGGQSPDEAASALCVVANVAGVAGPVATQVPNGSYRDVLTGASIEVVDGMVDAPPAGVVIEVLGHWDPTRWTSPLMDTFMHVELMGDDDLGE